MFLNAIRVDELEPGGTIGVELGGWRICVARDRDAFYAVIDRCTHQDSSLVGGRIRRGAIICPLHGAPFELATGRCLAQIAYAPLRSFPVRIEDGWVKVELP
jgi:3-phenylpropionate/trans-cinnamate dioxygenase ferredoxin subunit